MLDIARLARRKTPGSQTSSSCNRISDSVCFTFEVIVGCIYTQRFRSFNRGFLPCRHESGKGWAHGFAPLPILLATLAPRRRALAGEPSRNSVVSRRTGVRLERESILRAPGTESVCV